MALIHEQLAKIMSEIKAISKDRKNSQQGFNFRGIEDMYNYLQPLLAKHGVITIPELTTQESQFVSTKSGGQMEYTKITLKVHFVAQDGSTITSTVPGAGTDSGDKAVGKAMSYAHKYALIQTFCIPTQDVTDGDEESHTFTGTSNDEVYTGTLNQKQKLQDLFNRYNIKNIDTMKKIAVELTGQKLSSAEKIVLQNKA